MRLRKPHKRECDQINAMIMRSKAHWGYDERFMEACRSELALDEDRLSSKNIRVLANGDQIIGVVELGVESSGGDLLKLFVDPTMMGTGAGRILYNWALKRAKSLKISRMMIDSDPGASGFYQHMGAKLVGKTPSSSIAKRFLPLLQHDL